MPRRLRLPVRERIRADGRIDTPLDPASLEAAIAVLQRKADTSPSKTGLTLPTVNIDGATGSELATALGTIVTFDRAGVSYFVAGSVPPLAAENAARGLK